MSRRSRERYVALLPVVLYGGGCLGCAALRFSHTTEERYCLETGEFLFDWDKERGESCPLENIKREDFQV